MIKTRTTRADKPVSTFALLTKKGLRKGVRYADSRAKRRARQMHRVNMIAKLAHNTALLPPQSGQRRPAFSSTVPGKWMAVLMLLFCLCASSAFAGDLKLPASLLIGAQVADLTTTARAISTGRGYESNPLVGQGNAQRIAMKAITTTGTLFLASKLEQHHPKAAKVFLYSVAASVGVVAARNARIGR